MKILVLTPNFPSPTWGAGLRNYYLLKALATKHTVSLLTLIDSQEERAKFPLLADFVHTVHCVLRPVSSQKRLQQLTYALQRKSYFIGLNAFDEVQEALDTLCAQEHYDAVLFESALMAGYRLPDGVKRFIDQHNIEYELLWRTYQREAASWRKWYNGWESRVLRSAELKFCGQADLLFTTSEEDRRLLKQALPSTSIEIVPNGVDIEAFRNDAEERPSCQLLFTGAMNYYPNIDAVTTFARECWPRIRAEIPEASWVIVGREPPAEVCKLADLPGITVTGAVPDVRPYFASAALAIAPLQIGSGTRLKILEAFALRKAVVSTRVGCEGLSVVPEKHLLLADHPAEFAQAVITLLRDPAMRTRLGNAGRELVEQEYSWERCGSQLLRALEVYFPEREQVC